MNYTPERLYLDLIKKTLAFTLWPEPPSPAVERLLSLRHPFKCFMIGMASRLARLGNHQLVREKPLEVGEREEGRIWPTYAHTMIGLQRLDNLQYCLETVIQEGIAGDLIETGVWRGGACIFMRAILAAYRVTDRRVFVADSFEGLPRPDAERYPADKGDTHHIHSALAVSLPEVRDNFLKYGLLDDQVVFLKGWFKDTLPSAAIARLAVLRLDGDMYGSTFEVLMALYPKLAVGGFCIIDDGALPGCQKAVDDYRAQFNVTEEMRRIDWTGRFWRKERHIV